MESAQKDEHRSGTESDPFASRSNDATDVCKAQWISLYTTAAYCPSNPTPDTTVGYMEYFSGFKDRCIQGPFGGKLGLALAEAPIDPEDCGSNKQLLMYVCGLENRVRQSCDLPLRQCRPHDLLKRWRLSDGPL